MSIPELRARLDRGETTSRSLVEAALARATDAAGEGARAMTEIYADAALAAADTADRQRAAGFVASPLAGLPVTVKDLFDVRGRVTRAGSVVLADAPPATADATIVARLRSAGAIVIGKTNMTEFAYSGLGINPHYGTPRNPYDRATGRIPGGSSSGAAVSVTDGMAVAAIGTDTGGSVRIPAALCGLTGFKPTARRVPRTGTYPLSFTLDSIGPLAADVASCAIVDAVLAGDAPPALRPFPVRGLRLLAPLNYVLADADATVLAARTAALDALRAAGAIVDEDELAVLDRTPSVQANGGFSRAEAYWWHRAMIERSGDRYDPQILRRIAPGKDMTAVEYVELIDRRAAFVADFAASTERYDAVVWPTVAVVAPAIAALEADDAEYGRVNLLTLRNTSVINAADGCAISLPVRRAGDAPVGLMLAARGGEDARLLQIAAGVEAVIRPV